MKLKSKGDYQNLEQVNRKTLDITTLQSLIITAHIFEEKVVILNLILL